MAPTRLSSRWTAERVDKAVQAIELVLPDILPGSVTPVLQDHLNTDCLQEGFLPKDSSSGRDIGASTSNGRAVSMLANGDEYHLTGKEIIDLTESESEETNLEAAKKKDAECPDVDVVADQTLHDVSCLPQGRLELRNNERPHKRRPDTECPRFESDRKALQSEVQISKGLDEPVSIADEEEPAPPKGIKCGTRQRRFALDTSLMRTRPKDAVARAQREGLTKLGKRIIREVLDGRQHHTLHRNAPPL